MVKREKTIVKSRPMPQSSIDAFCLEMTKHKWADVLDSESSDQKADNYHKYLRNLLDKHFPEKTVTMTNLDKYWMTPEIKQLLRQAQRTRIVEGRSEKFKKLWLRFRKMKQKQIVSFRTKMVGELKNSDAGKWYSVMKKFGGLDQMTRKS